MFTHALINTFEKTDNEFGKVMSRHQSIEAAQIAAGDCQPKEQNSYLPVEIIELGAPVKKHEIIQKDGRCENGYMKLEGGHEICIWQ